MTISEYQYHIYAKEKCLYHSLSKKEFNEKWEMLQNMVGLMKTDYELEDLEYVKISVDKNGNGYSNEGSNEPSGGASY
tara:strand:- start:212 stop:445 length:234 start_codon:yes stop_codon:yes gene_type:complete